MEAGTALLCALVVVVKGADGDAIIGIALVLLLVPITLIDLDHHLIPNKITFPGSVLGHRARAVLDPDSLVENLIAAAGAGGFLFVAWFAVPARDGDGRRQARVRARHLPRARRRARDVRRVHRGRARRRASIIARMGVKEGRKAGIPFGPWLALGGIVGLLAGDEIVDWYLDTFT